VPRRAWAESPGYPGVHRFAAGVAAKTGVTVHRLDGIEARTMASNNNSTRRYEVLLVATL
jgi:hypothetical protein